MINLSWSKQEGVCDWCNIVLLTDCESLAKHNRPEIKGRSTQQCAHTAINLKMKDNYVSNWGKFKTWAGNHMAQTVFDFFFFFFLAHKTAVFVWCCYGHVIPTFYAFYAFYEFVAISLSPHDGKKSHCCFDVKVCFYVLQYVYTLNSFQWTVFDKCAALIL